MLESHSQLHFDSDFMNIEPLKPPNSGSKTHSSEGQGHNFSEKLSKLCKPVVFHAQKPCKIYVTCKNFIQKLHTPEYSRKTV